MSVLEQKEAIRRKILSMRKGLAPEEIQLKSALVTERLFTMDKFISCRFVLFYAALEGEVKTAFAVERSLELKKQVFLPKVAAENLQIFEIKSYERDTATGAFQIPEPVEGKARKSDPESLDLAIVPGLAFSETGKRLGFGKGYYDRFLSGLAKKIPLISLAFEFQIMDTLPATREDVSMDWIITEKRVIQCRNQS